MNKVNKLFHLLFALAVSYQLISAQWMHVRLKPGKNYPEWSLWLFQGHIYSGLFAGIMLLLYLIYNISQQDNHKLSHLFPWSKNGLKLVLLDLVSLVKFKFPKKHDQGGAKGFVQGLGVLLVLSVALTGFLWFTVYSITGSLNSPTIYIIKETHEYLANTVWFYLGGHVGMFILHLLFDKNRKLTTNAISELTKT
ncbi:MAG: cytochrome b/b6 domain-containing protein [Gammaproteobacteria bacterium]|nr:MAG: cytochrome b/b6 domain-containing protein [Gammaproteobacteria bacterium]UTW43417.1 cytochrome b/b6 domain-containing protein [bacterium SCSIO 12844]